MQVNYCDICDSILKEKKHYVVIFEDGTFHDSFSQSVAGTKNTFEVCDSCLKLVKEIFKYKKRKSSELKKIIDKMYDTDIKSIKRKRK